MELILEKSFNVVKQREHSSSNAASLLEIILQNLSEAIPEPSITRALQLIESIEETIIDLEVFICKFWLANSLYSFKEKGIDASIEKVIEHIESLSDENMIDLIDSEWLNKRKSEVIPVVIQPGVEFCTYIACSNESLLFLLRELKLFNRSKHYYEQFSGRRHSTCSIIECVGNRVLLVIEECPKLSGLSDLLMNTDSLEVLLERISEALSREVLLRSNNVAVETRKLEMISILQELRSMRSQAYVCFSYKSQLELLLAQSYKTLLTVKKYNTCRRLQN